jgi:hypothetical protein
MVLDAAGIGRRTERSQPVVREAKEACVVFSHRSPHRRSASHKLSRISYTVSGISDFVKMFHSAAPRVRICDQPTNQAASSSSQLGPRSGAACRHAIPARLPPLPLHRSRSSRRPLSHFSFSHSEARNPTYLPAPHHPTKTTPIDEPCKSKVTWDSTHE